MPQRDIPEQRPKTHSAAHPSQTASSFPSAAPHASGPAQLVAATRRPPCPTLPSKVNSTSSPAPAHASAPTFPVSASQSWQSSARRYRGPAESSSIASRTCARSARIPQSALSAFSHRQQHKMPGRHQHPGRAPRFLRPPSLYIITLSTAQIILRLITAMFMRLRNEGVSRGAHRASHHIHRHLVLRDPVDLQCQHQTLQRARGEGYHAPGPILPRGPGKHVA